MRLPDPDIVDYGTDPQILRSLISFYPETRNRKIKIARKVPIKKRLIYQKLIACELSLLLSSIGLSDRRVLGWPTTLQLIDAPAVCISMGEVRILWEACANCGHRHECSSGFLAGDSLQRTMQRDDQAARAQRRSARHPVRDRRGREDNECNAGAKER